MHCVLAGAGRAAGPVRPLRGARPAALALCAAVALFAAVGCGYAFVGAPGADDGGDDHRLRVAVRTFVNTTTEPGADLVVTDALRDELFDRPRVRVVSQPASADWTVAGRIEGIRIRTETFSSVVLALEQSLTMSVDLDVRDREGRRLEISDSALSGTEVFLASADLEATRKNRAEALRRVAGVIASRVVDALEVEASP